MVVTTHMESDSDSGMIPHRIATARQSSDVPEMRTFLSDQLWCIAEDTLGVDRPTAAGGGLNWSRVRTNTAEATVTRADHIENTAEDQGTVDDFSNIHMEEPAISQCVLNPILLQGNENISMEIVTGKRRKTDGYAANIGNSDLVGSIQSNESTNIKSQPLDNKIGQARQHNQLNCIDSNIIEDNPYQKYEHTKNNSKENYNSFDKLGCESVPELLIDHVSETSEAQSSALHSDQLVKELSNIESKGITLTEDEREWFKEVAFD